MSLVVASFVEFLFLLGCKIGRTTLFSFATALVVDGFVNIILCFKQIEISLFVE